MARTEPWEFLILGEPASKSNSRRAVRRGKHTLFIKSDKALRYVETFNQQCPILTEMFDGDVAVDMEIFYASRRPDLDESLILDCLQGRIYINDRQVKSKTIKWGYSPECPRTYIRVRTLESSDLPSHTRHLQGGDAGWGANAPISTGSGGVDD